MTLDVEVPEAPSLRGPQSRGEYAAIDMTDQEPVDDYRREEVAEVLADGAWQDAFEEWAAHTLLSETEFERVVELGLLEELDLYWDPAADEVGYRAPTVPEADRSAFEDVQGVEEALDALGRVVSEVLENDYLVRDADEFGFFADEYTGEETTEEL
jgi:hypothetical protein